MPSGTKLRLPLLLLLSLVLCSAAALPPAFTSEGNPSLYKKLSRQAKANLQNLDRVQKRSYQALLRSQPDVLMAYLLAYESDATLRQADPQAVLSNYAQIRAYLETYGTQHAPEFFLSYVADQTVSDERIEAYRTALLDDGLRELLKANPNETDLYRAVSQWCVARLKFQPTSGRDQSPLDITQKSILGRCEEMQILFVAAARTVGLPARPASTPWWPHIDNNHAWAEVWLDGAWHYTGDMDAAYYPDQTWFSGLIDKTVLILADGTLPSESDEVLVRGKYECLINSIRNYAGERTRSVKIQVRDEQDIPVPEADLGIMVYNWNSLRPLIFIKSEADGSCKFSAGRGAFYVSAYHDGKKALQLVPSGEEATLEYTLVLKDEPLPDQDEMLFYPSNPFAWKTAPQVWKDGVDKAKAAWEARQQSFASQADDYADSLAGELAAASRGNFPQISKFLERNPEVESEFLEFILSPDAEYFDPKFLWQAKAENLEALFRQYQEWKLELEAEDLALVLSTAVHYEEISEPFWTDAKTPSLYPPEFFFPGDTRLQRLNKAMSWLKKRYKISSQKSLQGLLPLHVALRQKYLSPYQYRILATCLARANRVPAQFSRQPNLIYVRYDNGQWGYYDLQNCAPEADLEDAAAFTELRVLASDSFGAPVDKVRGNLQLCRYQDGAFYWLDQEFEDYGNGTYAISVPRGEYYLNLGYRVSDSQTAFQMKHLELSQEEKFQAEFALRDYPRNWNTAGKDVLDVLRDVETADFDVVLIGNHDQENSIRLAEKLQGLGKNFLLLGYESAEVAAYPYMVSATWLDLTEQDQRNQKRTVTLVRKDGAWQSYEGLWERLPE